MPTLEVARECTALVKPSLAGNETPGYKRLQQELLRLSPNGRQRIADQSVHAVEIDQPEVVVDAIHEIVNAVRRR